LNRMGPNLKQTRRSTEVSFVAPSPSPTSSPSNSPGVESSNTLLSCNPGESSSESVGESGLGHETDSDGLKGAESDVGEELSDGGGTEIDGLSVLPGGLDTIVVDGGLLPELVTSELEGSLDRVSDLFDKEGAKREGDDESSRSELCR
jgi:hypothetical protein